MSAWICYLYKLPLNACQDGKTVANSINVNVHCLIHFPVLCVWAEGGPEHCLSRSSYLELLFEATEEKKFNHVLQHLGI